MTASTATSWCCGVDVLPDPRQRQPDLQGQDCSRDHQASLPDAGFTDFEDKTSGKLPDASLYRAVFRDSFRICIAADGEVGIYYFFKFENNKHKAGAVRRSLLASGQYGGHGALLSRSQRHPAGRAAHLSWITVGELRSGKSVFKDYNSETATSDLKAEHTEAAGHANDKHELYVYPGAYGARGDGTKLAKYRIEAERALTRAAPCIRRDCTAPSGIAVHAVQPPGLLAEYPSI